MVRQGNGGSWLTRSGCVEPGMETDAESGVWAAELESLLLGMGERFARVEPRRRMRDYARGLLGPVGRKNDP